jgi:hypothetical protein
MVGPHIRPSVAERVKGNAEDYKRGHDGSDNTGDRSPDGSILRLEQPDVLAMVDGAERERNTRLAVEYCLAHPRWRIRTRGREQGRRIETERLRIGSGMD